MYVSTVSSVDRGMVRLPGPVLLRYHGDFRVENFADSDPHSRPQDARALDGRELEVEMDKKESKPKSRGDRRDRTIRYGERARGEHLRTVHPDGIVDCVCERSVWFFAKKKSLGCSCRKRVRSGFGSPKLAGSLCHLDRSVRGYHPGVAERIAGRRLARAWFSEIRSSVELDDVEL
jgi:hypothetical protein